ncbi:MAG: DUF2190 family protein [Desulfobacterium sp.]|nr:DUF2190 family protein [Desulfobacterium sp.]
MKNYVGKGERITVTGPSGGLLSGAPYVVGSIPCVCSVDIAEGAAGAAATKGIFTLPVRGYAASANAAATKGAQLYYDVGEINLDSTNGTPFGFALEPVTSGETTTIEVLVK